jgi:mannitol/fructose-specific phosphotransferase system IIA component (Ntr-type)
MSELAEVLARDNIIDRLANVETPEAFIKLLEETRS